MNAPHRAESHENGTRNGRLIRIFRRPCVGYWKLIGWQMRQYRDEVEAHRMRLSRESARAVADSDAEESFCEEQGEVRILEWRREYCGSICEHRTGCPIAEVYSSAA